MNLVHIANKYYRTTISILIFILISGSLVFNNIPKESNPDVSLPYIYVSMNLTGISPEDAEKLLIKPIEEEVKNIEGKKELKEGIIVVYAINDDKVGIGTASPKAKLDVNNVFCVDSKTHTITDAFTTCLTVNLTNHTGCHVVITLFGDWPGHSSAAYRGEFFLQNGANAYAEPGIILRQDDNTSTGTDQIICQIVDPTSTANPKDFQIQIRHTDTTSPASWTGQLTYTVQGKFNSIT